MSPTQMWLGSWLWLWLWPAAAAPIGPLAWELPHATGAALKKKKKEKEKLEALCKSYVNASSMLS